MADDKDKKTSSDGKPDRDKMPIENPKVDVAVNPSRGESGRQPYHHKVRKQLEQEVRETLDKHRKDGSKKQLEEVQKTADEAAKKVDPNKVSNVKVRVGGQVGQEPIDKILTAPVEKPKVPDPPKDGK